MLPKERELGRDRGFVAASCLWCLKREETLLETVTSPTYEQGMFELRVLFTSSHFLFISFISSPHPRQCTCSSCVGFQVQK